MPEAPVPLHPLVRAASPDDVPRIRSLIVDLATFEGSADRVRTSEEQLRVALFGPQPLVHALVAHEDPARGRVVGFALYFLSFSTWEGTHGIYLEDLYVEPSHRGRGVGRALFGSLAAIAVEEGYARFEWSVLDWNTSAIRFYRSLGAEPLTEWTMFRLTGPALAAAALPVSAA